MSPHVRKDVTKHFRRQHAGIRVVARAVITAEQRHWPELVPAAVPEGDVGQFGAERAHSALVRDSAEHNDGPQFFHFGDRWRQKIAAGSYFFRGRLVLGRHAAHRIGDPAVDQFKSIVGMCAVFTARKAELAECLVKENAGIVAGERTAGPIGALQAGCEAHDQQTRIEAAERGDRRVEPGRFLDAPRFAKRRKPRAARAIAPRLAVGPCHSA